MSLILPSRWTQQPQQVVCLDRSNPLVAGLAFELLPASGIAPHDLIGGVAMVAQGGTLLKPSLGGVGWNVATTGTDGMQGPSVSAGYPISMGVVFVPGTLIASANLFNLANSTVNSSTSRLGLRLNATPTVSAVTSSSAGAVSASNSPNAPLVGRVNTAVGVFLSGASRKVYLNGQSGAVETTSRVVTGLDSTCIGSAAATVRQGGQVGQYLLAVTWNRALSDVEALSFTSNPWQIFAPSERDIWFAFPRIVVACAIGDAIAAGQLATISPHTSVACGIGLAAGSGAAASIATHTTVSGLIGDAAGAGASAAVATHTLVACGQGAAVAAGQQASLSVHTAVPATVGAAVAAGPSAGVSAGNTIAAGVGAATAAGLVASVTGSTVVGASAGNATAAGLQASVVSTLGIACIVGGAVAAGPTATISQTLVVGGNVGNATAAGMQAGIVFTTGVSAAVGAAAAAGLAATVRQVETVAALVGAATAAGRSATITINGALSAAQVWAYELPNGMTAAATLIALQAQVERIEKWLRNRRVTDPVAGTQTVYDDDGVSILGQGALYEDVAGTQPYRGDGADRAERLT